MEPTRREFLRSTATAPTLVALSQAQTPSGKFSPIDLRSYFHASAAELRPEFTPLDLERMPFGSQTLCGIPFLLGPGGQAKSWLLLRHETIEVPLKNATAHFVCLAQFCDAFEPEAAKAGEEYPEELGERLADAILRYADGSEAVAPIRRRFEVSSPSVPWGQLAYGARPHRQHRPTQLNDALEASTDWGYLQTAVADGSYGAGTVWLWALPNPHPERPLQALRLRGTGGPLVVCGVTLCHSSEHPLRYRRLTRYRITLPEAGAAEKDRWKATVDLGIVARSYALADFDPVRWLEAPDAGIGHLERPSQSARHLYLEITAAPAATLSLRDTRSGRTYEFDLTRLAEGQELAGREKSATIELLEARTVWVRGTVTDAASGRPTPARIAFRSKDGRYIPPYGHRTEINPAWFQDYGADVKLMDSSFAYVDGTFQIELPVGEVYVEVSKGFEYGAMRRRLEIEPSRRELNLEVSRFTNLRAQGWMTADTHVHFLSPSTAVLEGQAEGLNLINLLAAQWGDLFTNVGDLSHGPLTSADGETTVWIGTENRQHLLGHLGLLGGHGAPVFPMSASGPGESYVGDPVWTSMADWADACRKREGLVVAVHFPNPTAEIAADMVLGKIDAVELFPHAEHFNTRRLRDWYRYLNCGYRVPCVGGTDKMGGYMAVGANRTYAYVGQEKLDFASWAKAVRKGNTFATTGPLLLLKVDGRAPGEEIRLGSGGGSVQARVEARGYVPFHKLELVQNGRVVGSKEAVAGTREMTLDESLKLSGPGWIAARCSSRHGPTTVWRLGIQAHTSPVYVAVPGKELFAPAAASYMLTVIEGARTWLDTIATRDDRGGFDRAHRVLAEARQHLEARIKNYTG